MSGLVCANVSVSFVFSSGPTVSSSFVPTESKVLRIHSEKRSRVAHIPDALHLPSPAVVVVLHRRVARDPYLHHPWHSMEPLLHLAAQRLQNVSHAASFLRVNPEYFRFGGDE